MITRLYRNLWEKVGIEHWLSDPNKIFLASLILFLPTQFGKHFWPSFASVDGIRIDYLSPTLYLTDIIIVFLILLNINNFRMAIRKVSVQKTKLRILTIFVFFLIGSIIYSPTPISSFVFLIKIIEYSLLVLILLIKRKEFLNILFKILPVTILFESLLAIAQFVNKGSLGGFLYFLGERSFNSQTPNIANASINGELILRPYATFSHPNVLAGFLLLSMTLIIADKINKEKTLNFLEKISIAIGTIALLLTFSRTSIFAFFLIVLYFFSKSLLKKKLQKIPTVLLLFITGALILTGLESRFMFNFADESFLQRKDLILASFKMIRSHPVFGVGLNNFLSELPKYVSSNNINFIQPVHNIPLLIISQIGIVGGIIILYFFMLVFVKTNMIGKIIILEIIFISLLDHYFLTIQQGQILLSVFIAFCIANYSLNDKIN